MPNLPKPPILALVHGMGEFAGTDWTADIRRQLTASLGYFTGTASYRRIEDCVEVRAIEYDHVFANWVQQVQQDVGRLDVALQGVGSAIGRELIEAVTALAPAEDQAAVAKVIWSTLMDPVLYVGSRTHRDAVRSTVQEQFAPMLEAAAQRNVRLVVVAHSQGTMVFRDALHWMRKTNPGIASYLPFRLLCNLANVSDLPPRALQDLQSQDSLVVPFERGGLPRTCLRLLDVRHAFDPIAMGAPPAYGQASDRLETREVRHVRALNVHGFTHYLQAPEIAREVLRGLGFEPGELTAAGRDAETRPYPDCETALEQWSQDVVGWWKKVPSRTLTTYAVLFARSLLVSLKPARQCAGVPVQHVP